MRFDQKLWRNESIYLLNPKSELHVYNFATFVQYEARREGFEIIYLTRTVAMNTNLTLRIGMRSNAE